ERGGMTPSGLYRLLCQGPFARVDQPTFVQLLRDLGSKKALVSAEDGVLLLGELGERLVAHYSFYSAFATPEEYRLVCDGKTLGTIPVDRPIHPEGYIVFAARRWRVVEFDEKAKVILVQRASAGKAPAFSGDGPFGTLAEVRRRMRELYVDTSFPAYCDPGAQELMGQGRSTFGLLGLDKARVVRDGTDAWVFLWTDDFSALTLALALRALGYEVDGDGLALEAKDTTVDALRKALLELSTAGFPSAQALAASVPNKVTEKHDWLLSEGLLNQDYAARNIDVEGAVRALADLQPYLGV
ncbi:MAG: DEAD/DEAH box helicase, partial [bacterium]